MGTSGPRARFVLCEFKYSIPGKNGEEPMFAIPGSSG